MTEFMYVWYYNKKYFYIYDFINFLLQLCEVAVGTPPLYMKKQALSERICDLFTTAEPAGGSLDMNSGLYPSKNSIHTGQV